VEIVANLDPADARPTSDCQLVPLRSLEPEDAKALWSIGCEVNNGAKPTPSQLTALRNALVPESPKNHHSSKPLPKSADIEGLALNSEEIEVELSRFFPRVYQGLLRHLGEKYEAQAIAFIEDFLDGRKEALRDKKAS
jgi:hypothetical protein